MAFIRILSPKSAPPVLRFEGSTEIKPIVFSGKSIKKRRTNSSTNDDFPAPPVPVIPNTGVLEFYFFNEFYLKCPLQPQESFLQKKLL